MAVLLQLAGRRGPPSRVVMVQACELFPSYLEEVHYTRRRRKRSIVLGAVISFEAPRGYPQYFAAAGTAIVSTARRTAGTSSATSRCPAASSPSSTAGGRASPSAPVRYTTTCAALPAAAGAPSCRRRRRRSVGVAPPFDRVDVTSYAMVGRSAVFSTETEAEATLFPDGKTIVRGGGETRPATFTFDAAALAWERRGDWALPFFRPCALQLQPGRHCWALQRPGHLRPPLLQCSCKAAAAALQRGSSARRSSSASARTQRRLT
ncbi:unnamed protein product [Urochloa humidicola]